MKKVYFIIGLSMYTISNAQVGINTSSPDPSSALDIVSDSKGILIPRVELMDTSAQLSSNPNAEGLLAYNIGTANLSKGFYYWNGTYWESISGGMKAGQKFFYMPSMQIDTRTNQTGVKRDLYKEYVAQFTNKTVVPSTTTPGEFTLSSTPNPTFVKSVGAPNAIPVILSEDELYYYVTYYDQSALANISIDAKGVMTYDVIGSGTDYSFVNVVFVVK